MSNAKLLTAVAAGVLSLGLGACSTISVKTDVARDATLTSCRTYTFAQEHVANADQPAAYANPLNAERLKVAIQANLASRGIQAVSDRTAADCVVGYALGSRQVFDNYYGGLGIGYGYGWGGGRRFGGGFGGGFGYYDGPWVDNETRVAVDVFDAKTRKPIWHASASQSAYDLSGPRAEERINAATAAIFNKWPLSGPASARTST
jgi:Domain of unknown function (DUF4136)